MVEDNIKYVTGDATDPIVNTGHRVIAHICNNVGAWGMGFVLSILDKWPEVRNIYIKEMKNNRYVLGSSIVVNITDGLDIYNMIAQDGLISKTNPVPLSYDALYNCLLGMYNKYKNIPNVSVHMPKIGTGLAGGDWNFICPIINDTVAKNNTIDVYVYNLK